MRKTTMLKKIEEIITSSSAVTTMFMTELVNKKIDDAVKEILASQKPKRDAKGRFTSDKKAHTNSTNK